MSGVPFSTVFRVSDDASRIGRQSLIFFSAQAVNALLGIAVYSLLTRAMTVEEFGSYSFVITFVTFLSIFFDYGLASSGMRLLAVTESGEERRRLGSILIVATAIGMVMSVVTALSSVVVDDLFTQTVGGILLLVAPFVFVVPLQESLLNAAQGRNRMVLLSVYLVAPRIVLIVILGLLLAVRTVSVGSAAVATYTAMLIAVIGVSLVWRPMFDRIRIHAAALQKEIREFGSRVYTGRVIDGMTKWTDRLLISLFHGMTPLGIYAIAMTMSMPIGMFSLSVSTSAYKRFAHEPRIPTQLLLVNFLLCIGGAVVLVLACQILIPLLFTARYEDSLHVLPLLAGGVAVAGLNHPFHAFFSAQRQGKVLRTISVSTSVVNVILNLLLVPYLALTGAAVAYLASYMLNIAMNIRYYVRFRRSLGMGN